MASGALSIVAVVTLGLLIIQLIDVPFDESLTPAPERLSVDISSPPGCEELKQMESELNRTITNARSCTSDSDCALVDGTCHLAVSSVHIDAVKAARSAVSSLRSKVYQTSSCGPIVKMSGCHGGDNPAALCIDQMCTYRYLGFPPGL